MVAVYPLVCDLRDRWFMSNVKLQLPTNVGVQSKDPVSKLQRSDSKAIVPIKLPPSTTTRPPLVPSKISKFPPAPPSLSSRDSDLDLCDAIDSLSTRSPDVKRSKSSDPCRKSSFRPVAPAPRSLGVRHYGPSFVQHGTHKFVYADLGNTAPTTSIGHSVLNQINQGDNVSDRIGDAIYMHGIAYDFVYTQFPHTASATAQNWTSADLCANHTTVTLSVSLLPVTAGTTDFNIGYSAANPPTLANGDLSSLGAQGTVNGSQYFINPNASGQVAILKFFKFHFLQGERGSNEAKINLGTTKGELLDTYPPRVVRVKGYIPLRRYAAFVTGTSSCSVNLVAVSVQSSSTQAARLAMGWDCAFSGTTKITFTDPISEF